VDCTPCVRHGTQRILRQHEKYQRLQRQAFAPAPEHVGDRHRGHRPRFDGSGHGGVYKADVNVRVAWCGIGINLATNIPTPAALGNAVRTVLDTQNYRLRAARMADEFAAIDVRAEILRIVRQVVSS
jgi:hypothetical protein